MIPSVPFARTTRPRFKPPLKVLELAHELKLTRVGTISVDGTKVQANASKHAAVSYQRAGELITQLELEVQALVTRAEQADASAPKETLNIPAEPAPTALNK